MSSQAKSAHTEAGAPRGWTYAVPGIISWLVVSVCLVGLFAFPRYWQPIVTLGVAYCVFRMAIVAVFGLVGEVRRRAWERTDFTEGESEPGPAGFAPADVVHVVFVPNYREPLDVLERTIAGLAKNHRASERIVLVLGMEEREHGSREKGEALAERFRDSFLRVIVTVHPGGLPGELACKASNQTYAAIEARRVLVEEMGIAPELITLTSADADSVIHPKYFSAVSRLFAHDEKRYARFWQAPMVYYNNIWDVHAPIRYEAWFLHAGHFSQLAHPFYVPLPVSTYTLSLKMAERTGWWDPAVISEDWHVMLNCLYEGVTDVSLTPVFLPTSSDATDGETLFQAVSNRYAQVLRHCWGAEDAGYALRRVLDSGRLPAPAEAFRVVQVLHDHVLRVAGWAFVMSGYALSAGLQRLWDPMNLDVPVWHTDPWLQGVLITGGVLMAASFAVEFFRNPPADRTIALRTAGELGIMWLLAPAVGFVFGALPALHAQSKLMFGIPLAWKVTPKRMAERLSES